MDDARSFGFRELVLDTGPIMTSAHRLYEARGFIDSMPYPEAKVPQPLHHGWRFMRTRGDPMPSMNDLAVGMLLLYSNLVSGGWAEPINEGSRV